MELVDFQEMDLLRLKLDSVVLGYWILNVVPQIELIQSLWLCSSSVSSFNSFQYPRFKYSSTVSIVPLKPIENYLLDQIPEGNHP